MFLREFRSNQLNKEIVMKSKNLFCFSIVFFMVVAVVSQTLLNSNTRTTIIQYRRLTHRCIFLTMRTFNTRPAPTTNSLHQLIQGTIIRMNCTNQKRRHLHIALRWQQLCRDCRFCTAESIYQCAIYSNGHNESDAIMDR